MIISMCIGHTSEVYIWLSNKLLCKIYIRDTLNYLNSHCNTAKLLWVVIYVVCYGWFPPDLVVMNICRQRLIKVDRPLWQRSLANENAVVCRQGAMRWRLLDSKSVVSHLVLHVRNLIKFMFYNKLLKPNCTPPYCSQVNSLYGVRSI